MPRADRDAAAEDGREPVEARRPEREAGQRRIEEAQRDDPVDEALGEGESCYFGRIVIRESKEF